MKNENLFDQIYKYGRPVSHHPSMTLADRAKIFSPFAALRGHGSAVEAMQQFRCDKIQLTESELEPIHTCLQTLKKQDLVEVTYFVDDPGPDGSGGIAEGEYRTVSGAVLNLFPSEQKLRLHAENAVGWLEIRFDDIYTIKLI